MRKILDRVKSPDLIPLDIGIMIILYIVCPMTGYIENIYCNNNDRINKSVNSKSKILKIDILCHIYDNTIHNKGVVLTIKVFETFQSNVKNSKNESNASHLSDSGDLRIAPNSMLIF